MINALLQQLVVQCFLVPATQALTQPMATAAQAGSMGNSITIEIDVDKEALHASDPIVESAITNLSTFSSRGGKILFFHGDSESWFSPLDTLEYYQSLAVTNGGAEEVAEWGRMFLVPGMAHCGGGPALDHFDMLSAMVTWVEKGTAQDELVATGQAFPGSSRPLCAYPKHAEYIGSGNSEDAKNFRCR